MTEWLDPLVLRVRMELQVEGVAGQVHVDGVVAPDGDLRAVALYVDLLSLERNVVLDGLFRHRVANVLLAAVLVVAGEARLGGDGIFELVLVEVGRNDLPRPEEDGDHHEQAEDHADSFHGRVVANVSTAWRECRDGAEPR